MPEPRYLLLLEEDVPVDARKFGPIVQSAIGVSLAEARMAVRRGRGIFLENLAEEDALRIARELGQDGIRARAVRSDEAPSLPPLKRAGHVERSDEFLTYIASGESAKESLPWDALFVIHVGVVAKPQYKDLFHHVPFHMVPAIHKLVGSERDLVRENLILKMGNAPASPAAKKKGADEAVFGRIQAKYGSAVKVSADLVTADLGTWLRISLDDIGYVRRADAVKVGDAWGFEMFVNDLGQRRGAAFTEMTLKLLQGADIRETVFPQIEEYNRYVAWVATKRTLWPTADSSSPSPGPPAPPTDGGSSNASPGPEAPSTSS